MLSFGVVALAGSASALTITANFQSSVLNDSRSADFIAAFNYAKGQFESAYSDNIHVVMNVQLASGTQILGQSQSTLVGVFNYNQIKTALTNDAVSTDDATAVANMGADPTGGGEYWTTRAQAKALSLIADDTNLDGTVTFGAGYNYAFDPNNRAQSGKFDFIGVASHEITEIMGRIGIYGRTVTTHAGYDVNDLFRYQNGNHNMTSNTSATNYFSIDGGTTHLVNFNNTVGGDLEDYAGQSPDAFNAFLNLGQEVDVTSVGYTNMDVIGYDAVPEPMSIIALSGLATLALKRKRKA